MNAKTKIVNKLRPMNQAEFNNFADANKAGLVALSRAIMFAVDQCVAGKHNTAPLNAILRFDSMQTRKHRMYQIGAAVVDYTAKLLHGAVEFEAERGQVKWVSKSAPLAAIDWQTVPTFAAYFANRNKAKVPSDNAVRLVTVGAISKLVADVVANGIKDSDNVEALDAITAALPDFQRRITEAHKIAQGLQDDKAEGIAEGATGEETRKQAHAAADDKAVARAPRKPRAKTAMAAAMEKAAENTAKLAAAA
jgi:hypothetical protein